MCPSVSSFLPQLDGNTSLLSDTTKDLQNTSLDASDGIGGDTSENECDNESDTEYETDDEAEPLIIPMHMNHISSKRINTATSLPLICVANARSLYNKSTNFKHILHELGVEIALISETLERQELSLDELLSLQQHKIISYKRPKRKERRQPGGGAAIVYSENRFSVSKLDVSVPHGVEIVWAMVKPKQYTANIQKLAIASVYVSPSSVYKTKTIDHIIETIHFLKSQHGSEIKFLIGGDVNRINIDKILHSYGSLNQIISVPTRKSESLEKVITDLQTYFHPPTSHEPIEVDEDKDGENSDHNVVILTPVNIPVIASKRVKRTIKTRPLPESRIRDFYKFMTIHNWSEVLDVENIDDKTENFHKTLAFSLDLYFPEKVIKVSSLDKCWMTPQLKQLQRQVQREYFRKRKSDKWKLLKTKLKKLKRKTMKKFYNHFVTDLKETEPAKWYSMAKKIGAVNQKESDRVPVECLDGLDDQEAVEEIAQHFARISQEYEPILDQHLPCYLPAEKPPQVNEDSVYLKLKKIKKTKSTLPIDLPCQLTTEFASQLSSPVTDIINTSLQQHKYPTLWKHEWVVPAPKKKEPKCLEDLRKISCTSDFSKLYEGFLKEWILEDIKPNLDFSQYGNEAGTGTEHMLVAFIDKVLKLLDTTEGHAAVIAAMVDWRAAFDRQDPTLAIQKFLNLGLRSSLVQVLVSYLQERKMTVKYNQKTSRMHDLPGGGPQGTLIGGIEYSVQSNDNGDFLDDDMKYKYVDDMSILEFLSLSGLLVDYDVLGHVPSDVGVDHMFLPSSEYSTQSYLNNISQWTSDNLMQLNESKSSYMIFTRMEQEFRSRLTLNNIKLDQVHEV